MITLRNTKNRAGVCISGDYNDLNALVNAFYEITIDEFSEKYTSYIDISTRVLGLCYDVRHAMQGDRDVELVNNGMTEDLMKFHSVIAPKKNVYYQCNYLYPEMFFVMIALNELIKLRARTLAKSRYGYNDLLNRRVIWDETIAVLRTFQAKFQKCVRELLTEASFARWLKVMNNDYIGIEEIAGQYIDFLNIEYINMSKEKREKNLTKMARRIAEFRTDKDYLEIKEVVEEAALEYGCPKESIRLAGIEYPDTIDW
ncbi:MAG: hypothetical protein GXZ07_08190 [Firmicutes bacterium]|nr:hypothetical protein [Bacillota bacterium]